MPALSETPRNVPGELRINPRLWLAGSLMKNHDQKSTGWNMGWPMGESRGGAADGAGIYLPMTTASASPLRLTVSRPGPPALISMYLTQ